MSEDSTWVDSASSSENRAASTEQVRQQGSWSSSAIPRCRAPGWVQTAQFMARPDIFLERNWRRYGDVFGARIYSWGTGNQVVIADPQLIKQVYRGSPSFLRLGEVAGKPVRVIVGPNSLLALDGPEHLRHRKLMMPPLHGERLRQYHDIIVDATDRSLEGWPVGRPFPLRPRMADITLEVIMRAIFGVERGRRYDELHGAVLQVIENNLPVNLAIAFPALRRNFGPVRAWSTFRDAKARVAALLYDEIATRRRANDLDQRSDILSMLLLARYTDGTPMTDEELHDELLTLLLAGHETTSTALAWTFDLLLHNPATLRRLTDEFSAGDERYLVAVVREALRVRPVVATSQRVLREPMKLGGYALDSGVTLLLAIWLVHRRPELYPDPEAFRPERFLEQEPGTYEWIPFGGGVRRCIGDSLAQMEMQVILKRILTQVKLEPANPDLERPRNRFVLLAPKQGTMVTRV